MRHGAADSLQFHHRDWMNIAAANLQQEVLRLLRNRDWRAAAEACGRLNVQYPDFAAGWHSACQVAIGLGNAAEALACIDRALGLEPRTPQSWIQRGQCLLALGRLREAGEAAAAAQENCTPDPVLLDAIGTLYSQANDQTRAIAAYDRAVELAPHNPLFIFNRATVRRYLGALAAAETDYDRVIALNPADFEAYKNRSELRTQSADRNHVPELQALVGRSGANWRGAVQLHYALAKELEDLGEYEQSFRSLQHGAKIWRQHLRYNVANDVATVDWIIEAFPAAPVPITPEPRACTDAPIFIVGLPRSGTTLVERILGSHSSIYSAGELNSFALTLVDAVRRQCGRTQVARQELVTRSATLDFPALGRDYLESARAAGARGERFTDKMPLNYVYCGLIRRALPQAKIVHVHRSPLAACYAIHKTLFKDGYPFAYDLTELGQYYVAYRRLMEHWQLTLPGSIFSLSYESLVADQIGQTRKLLEFCGLEWQDACARFHDNPSPSTTASAAQVRRPIYDSSVSQWRHYRSQLAELSAQLMAAGIRIDE
jgi:tetratricopeptide (TPR) repeat protein